MGSARIEATVRSPLGFASLRASLSWSAPLGFASLRASLAHWSPLGFASLRAPLAMTEPSPPPGVPVTRYRHRVPFYETDAMGLVHHANYVRFLELARIRWMDEHHRPYREYVAEGLHFATTRVELDYVRGLRFDDEVEIAVWLAWARGASLRMEYALSRAGEVVARGATEHAMVDTTGRVRRIPEAQRRAMAGIAAERAAGSP